MRQGGRPGSTSAARSRTRGFTLIECLIASIVLVFITTAVVYTLSASRQNAKYIEEQRNQIALGDALVARMAAMRYDGPDKAVAADSLDAKDGYSDTLTRQGKAPTGDPDVDGPLYDVTVAVKTTNAYRGDGAKAGVLTVHVTGPSGWVMTRRRVVPVAR